MLQDIDQSLRAVVDIELAENIRQVVLDRLLADEERLRNILVAEALGDTRKHVHLARGQTLRAAFTPHRARLLVDVLVLGDAAEKTLGQRRIDKSIALVHDVDCLDEHRRLDILQEIAENAVFQQLQHIIVAVMDGQHNNLRL